MASVARARLALSKFPRIETEFEATAAVFPTELGWMLCWWRDERLAGIRFSLASPGEARRACPGNARVPDVLRADQRDLVERLTEYAKGRPTEFADVLLDDGSLTPFQRRVTQECRKIPCGGTLSYAALAVRAGSPRAARAVGSVMRQNRWPLIVPCHRVVGAGKCLGGFSAPGGLDTKLRLLALESAMMAGTATTRGGDSAIGRPPRPR